MPARCRCIGAAANCGCVDHPDQAEYAETVVNRLKAAGIRAEADLRADKISYKIRELSLQKLPTSLWWAAKRPNKAQSRFAGAAIRTWA